VQELCQNQWARVQHVEKNTELMHVHRISKVTQQLLGASLAGLLLVGITCLAADQFLVLVGHGTAADPFFILVDMDMVEFRHGAMIDLIKVAPAQRPLLQCYFLRY
jgi:hypothetical protein